MTDKDTRLAIDILSSKNCLEDKARIRPFAMQSLIPYSPTLHGVEIAPTPLNSHKVGELRMRALLEAHS
jgi:hypothetical protein